MGHEMTVNDTMVSYRKLPWHGLGTVVDEAFTSADAIVLAGLDWEVELLPLSALQMIPEEVITPAHLSDPWEGGATKTTAYIPKYWSIEDKFATMAMDNNQIFGVVGGQYTVVQNREAFAFLDSLASDGEVTYETAGSMKDRAHIFMCVKLPAGTKVAGEEYDIYIVVSNFHDGSGALRIDLTPVRVVCKNTQVAAFGQAIRTWRLRHTTSIIDRLEEARNTLELTRNYNEEFTQIMERLALEEITRSETVSTLNKIWMPKGDLQISEVGASVLTNLELSDTIPEDHRHTKYGLFNAATEFLDWKQDFRSSTSVSRAEQQFGRIDKNTKVKGDLLAVLAGV